MSVVRILADAMQVTIVIQTTKVSQTKLRTLASLETIKL